MRWLGLLAWILLLGAPAPSHGATLQDVARGAAPLGDGLPGPDERGIDETIDSGELRSELVWFGVGNVARPGDWVGVRIETTDLGAEPREIMIQLELDDPDGDTQRATRVVTSNPGQTLGTWVYMRLPFSFGAGSRIRVVVSEARATADASGYARGRVLSRYQTGIPGGRTSPRALPVTLLVGPTDLGMRGLAPTAPSTQTDWTHEPRLVELVTHRDLPDRWQGLAAFDSIVWGPATGDEYSPLTLDTARADAIRAWVRRGGHLVVVLPLSGQLWSPGARNPLLDLLPRVETVRHEGVELDALRTLFTDSAQLPLPASVVHGFRIPPDTPRLDAMPIIDAPDAMGSVVVRRLAGAGTVTLVGLPLGDRRLTQAGLPQAAQIWHHVLGGAGDTHRDPDATPRRFPGGTQTVALDESVATEISDTGSAAVGVLLGMLLFGAYWLIAGPLVYFGLGKARRQHAWVGFFASTLVFTVIAWAGAQAIRPKETAATHLSVLTGVHGAEWVRARTFASVLVPEYGDAEISVGVEPAPGMRSRDSDLLGVWDPPEGGGVVGAGFPDARAYEVPATLPRAFDVPVRQTVKQFVADWAGPAPEAWGLPRPVRDVGDRFEPELRWLPGDRADGILEHDLPTSLQDVEILVIRGATLGPVTTDLLRSNGRAYRLRDPWAPQTALELARLTAPLEDGRPTGSLLNGPTGYLDDVAGDAKPRQINQWGGFGNAPIGDGRTEERMRALPFLRVLPEATQTQGQTRVQYTRRMMHGLDLAVWFTQPCIIVTGRLELDEVSEAGTPAPIGVNGEPVAARGTTLVWWVYPLEPDPPSADVYGALTDSENAGTAAGRP